MLGIVSSKQNNNNKTEVSSKKRDVIDTVTSDVDRAVTMQDDVIRLAEELEQCSHLSSLPDDVTRDVSSMCQTDLIKLRKMEDFCKVHLYLSDLSRQHFL